MKGRVQTIGLVIGGVVWLCRPADSAAQQRESALLDADGPPSQPGLAHRGTTFNFEYMVASAEPTDVTSVEPIEGERAFAYAGRWLVEVPIAPRKWFLGLVHDIAAASVPASREPRTGGSTFVLGNPELWARGLWYSVTGLAAGGGIGIVVPVPRTYPPLEAEVVRAIRVIRPWDYPHFQDLTATARPFFDIRHATGPVTLQMRQGIDFSILLRDRDESENRYDLAALASLYVGLDVFKPLIFGIEVSEVYQLTADVSSPSCLAPCDEHRIAVTLSPTIRLRLPGFSPAISAMFPLVTPLRAEVETYYAARLNLDVEFGWAIIRPPDEQQGLR